MSHIQIPTALLTPIIATVIISRMPLIPAIVLIAIAIAQYVLILLIASGYGVGDKWPRPLMKGSILLLGIAAIIISIAVGHWICVVPFGGMLLYSLLTMGPD